MTAAPEGVTRFEPAKIVSPVVNPAVPLDRSAHLAEIGPQQLLHRLWIDPLTKLRNRRGLLLHASQH